MVTIKEYAEIKGVSTQAVYKQLKTHEKALQGHVQKIKGTRYLDDEAVAYLNKQSESSPAVVIQTDNEELLEALKVENENLKIKIMELQDQLIHKSDMVIGLQEEMRHMITQKEEPTQQPEEKQSFFSRLWHKGN